MPDTRHNLLIRLLPLVILSIALAVGCSIDRIDGGGRSLVGVIENPLVSTDPVGFNPESRHDERPLLSEVQYRDLAGVLRSVYTQPADQWPKPHVDEGVAFVELGLMPAETPYPADNPPDDAKAELGKLLFFDGRLSGPGQMSCASCHTADLGWADGRARSLGHGAHQLSRNTPSMLNSAFMPALFWDGRAESLEDLVVAVLTNIKEMNATPDHAVNTVAAIPGYVERFEAVFGKDSVNMDNIAKAMATHIRTVRSEPSSAFDRFLMGDSKQLSDSAVRGLHLFRTDARCVNCHSGPMLTDNQFHDLGLSYYGRKYEDLGRYEVTHDNDDVGKFKTPSLRNVSRTAPYMHVGFFDLKGVVNMYNAGMATLKPKPEQADDPLFPTKSPLLEPLHLNEQDRADLVAFLESLTERRRRDLAPTLPEDPGATRTTDIH